MQRNNNIAGIVSATPSVLSYRIAPFYPLTFPIFHSSLSFRCVCLPPTSAYSSRYRNNYAGVVSPH